MTGLDMIARSLRLIGVLAAEETPSAPEAADGLVALNGLLGSWSNEGLLIHSITQESPITLVPGDGTYTLGTAGDLANRPMSIERAIIRDGTTDYPLNVRTADEYAVVSDKSVQSTLPSDIYDDGGFPLRTLTLYPIPSAANGLILFVKRQLTSIATLNTSISLPPGYDRAIAYNLAIDMAPEYGKAVPDVVGMVAVESKASLKRTNHKPKFLRADAALISGGGFNIQSGDSR
jgi:hypothetical protein